MARYRPDLAFEASFGPRPAVRERDLKEEVSLTQPKLCRPGHSRPLS